MSILSIKIKFIVALHENSKFYSDHKELFDELYATIKRQTNYADINNIAQDLNLIDWEELDTFFYKCKNIYESYNIVSNKYANSFHEKDLTFLNQYITNGN